MPDICFFYTLAFSALYLRKPKKVEKKGLIYEIFRIFVGVAKFL